MTASAPTCDFEHRTSEDGGERYVCRRCGLSMRVPQSGRLPVANCRFVDLAVRSGPCIHLGDELRKEDCQSCAGRVRVKVFGCAVHGETTLRNCTACRDYRPPAALADQGGTLLLSLGRWGQGLGDHVQLLVVLKHLRALYPAWQVDVQAVAGTERMLAPFCRRVLPLHEQPGQYTTSRRLGWYEAEQSYADFPSTKAERCLREVFGITPRPEFCTYAFEPSAEAKQRVDAWLEKAGFRVQGSEPDDQTTRRPDTPGRFALIHFRGHAHRLAKNLSQQAVRRACKAIKARGIEPLLLDWYERPLTFAATIGRGHELCEGDRIDAEVLAALAQRARLCIGIDSGPGKIFEAAAAAVGTPTIICWPHAALHPLHYSSHPPQVLHLVTARHWLGIRGDRHAGLAYFERNYRHRVMRKNIRDELPAAIEECLVDWSSGRLVQTLHQSTSPQVTSHSSP